MRVQSPINSEFNKTSTVSEVLAGLDLAGKTAITWASTYLCAGTSASHASVKHDMG